MNTECPGCSGHHDPGACKSATLERAERQRAARERITNTARAILTSAPHHFSVTRALQTAEDFEFKAEEYVRRGKS